MRIVGVYTVLASRHKSSLISSSVFLGVSAPEPAGGIYDVAEPHTSLGIGQPLPKFHPLAISRQLVSPNFLKVVAPLKQLICDAVRGCNKETCDHKPVDELARAVLSCRGGFTPDASSSRVRSQMSLYLNTMFYDNVCLKGPHG